MLSNPEAFFIFIFIILCEDNKIINDTCEVSEKFNTFFSTVADKKIA
jgi:hypothetical protein